MFSKEPLKLDNTVGNVESTANKQAEPEKQASISTVQEESTVLISDIPDEVRKNIPNIAFEGHVYSSTVERRSVMINGKQMREGDAIGSSLVLREITPLGAEFEFKGYRFKLDALQDWSYR